MKPVLASLLLILLSGAASAQITITASDMPNEGDTFRFSNANSFIPIAYADAGANQTWDFADLTETNQFVDTFFNVLSTPFQYQAVFNLPLDPNRATIAKKEDDLMFGPVEANNPIFYYTEKSNRLQIKGFGARLNGLPTPVEYNSPDVIFEFPLSFNDQYSSQSSFSLDIPNFAFIGREIERDCEVTGWGTLITPLDSFQTIKLRCEVDRSDTIFVQNAGQGIQLERPTEVQYKWLAKKEGMPVLQVNTTEFFAGTEIVNDIFYQDTLTTEPPADTGDTTITSLPGEHQLSNSLKVFPNPVHSRQMHVQFSLSQPSPVTIRIMNIKGQLVSRQQLNKPAKETQQQFQLSLPVHQLEAGTYLLHLQAGDRQIQKKVVLQ